MLTRLTNKQVAALRFASDDELALLVERAAREQLKPTDIKRAVQTWVPDLDRPSAPHERTRVKPWIRIGEAAAPDGTVLTLQSRDGEFLLLAGRQAVDGERSARLGGRAGDARLPPDLRAPTPHVLIGGLGMGFTLRAALDVLPAAATCRRRGARSGGGGLESRPARPARRASARGPAGARRGDRCRRALRGGPPEFDAVLLDVDNGSDALTTSTNGWLYGDRGMDAHPRGADARRGTRRCGWRQRIRNSRGACASTASAVDVEHVRGRGRKRGPRHAVLLAYQSVGR